jgi:D-glycero-D-manno-heptose 1,7-bisphosphate phosphatase
MGIDTKIARPAIFLDRDGTIIEAEGMVTSASMLRLLPGAARAIKEWKDRGYFVICITNQPIVEKGALSETGLEGIHAALQEMLAKEEAALDAIYACPHRYREEGQCDCRKPGLGLIKMAQNAFPIAMDQSWFIGDRLRDVATGKQAGMKTIRVLTGGESADDTYFPGVSPDYEVADLVAAAALMP